MSTNYDCLKEDKEPMTWEMIVETMRLNADNVIELRKEIHELKLNCIAKDIELKELLNGIAKMHFNDRPVGKEHRLVGNDAFLSLIALVKRLKQ